VANVGDWHFDLQRRLDDLGTVAIHDRESSTQRFVPTDNLIESAFYEDRI
jgi:hypothetical protein